MLKSKKYYIPQLSNVICNLISGAPSGESPNVSRKIRPSLNAGDLRSSHMSTSRLRDVRLIMQDVTTFYIPGLDVRTQYISKTENEDTLFFDPSASFSKDGNGATWMTPGKD